jgi:hypothetical protein
MNDEDEVWWFVPVSVQGKTTQELTNFNLMQGNLVTHIAQMAIAYLKGNDRTVTND